MTKPAIISASKPAPIWRHVGTRIRTFLEARSGKAALKAAAKAEAPKPRTKLGKKNLARATALGWTLVLLRDTFRSLFPQSYDDVVGIRALQRRLGVKDDGDFGPKSYAALMRQHYAEGYVIIAGFPHRAPDGVVVRNWYYDSVPRLPHADRRGRTVNLVVGHESVSDSATSTASTLTRKGFGTQLMVTEQTVVIDGEPVPVVWQCGDLAWDRMIHAGSQNGPSVGLEVVSYYYARSRSLYVVKGRWVDKGSYEVPPQARLEATAVLLAWLTSDACPLPIPRTWRGLTPDGELGMSRVSGTVRAPGVHAHCYTAHADFAFVYLYSLLRIEGKLGEASAWDMAGAIATTTSREVQVAPPLAHDGVWRERAGRAA